MAFELLYALKKKEIWWIDILLYFLIALLTLTIIFYFVLDIEISAQKHKIEKFSQEIEKFGTPEQKEMEKKVFDYQKKIKEVSKLMKSHKIPSNFFALIEKITLPEVYFSTVTLSIKDSKVKLKGETENFEDLARELALLEKEENIKKAESFQTSLSKEGKVIFDLDLRFSPELFLWK